MRKSRFSEEQIIGILKEAEAGRAVNREKAAPGFIRNLERLRPLCEGNDILFLAASRQAHSKTPERSELDGLGYGEEQVRIEELLDEQGYVNANQMYFPTHGRLTQELRRWRREGNVRFVDVIAALDQRRSVLVSWVHLSPAGNRMIARALAPDILRRTCEEGASAERGGVARGVAG